MAQHEIDPEKLPYAPEKLPKKQDITIDDFFNVDLRTGRVVSVDDFPEARKPSYKIVVDFGPTVGTLATSAQVTTYGKDELVGRMIVGAINLGTKRIAGFKSEFLILGALDPDGRVRLLQLEDEVEPGAPVA
ncbi:MAG: tRNA-binding protein [Actinomycetota bacterium]